MKSIGVAVFLALVTGLSAAGEGMWLPEQLPELGDSLARLGLELDPASLTRLTEPPLSAVVDLPGCTGSFVSPQGLIVTNHHCVWGALQYNSTEERNLMDSGFLAGSLGAELPAGPGTRARVTVDVRNVTSEVTSGLDRIAGGAERYATIESREKRLIAECEKDPGHRCDVRAFYGGRDYYLTRQLEIRDVRLVYAPPKAIGQFGGEVDNWMWPRHTGDFSFLRAYVGSDGKPADPAAGNVPYGPRHHLRISPAGVEDDDYVMVVGYPGRTNRYRLASEVANTFDWFYPTMKEQMERMLAVIDEQSERIPGAAIAYATTVAGLNNAAKNYQGMLDGYARSDMLERKRLLELELERWIASGVRPEGERESALRELERLVVRESATQERDMVLGLIGRSAMLSTARRLYRLSRERELPDAEREPGYQERDMSLFRERLDRLDRRYHPEVDKALLRMHLERYRELPPHARVAALDAFLGIDDPATPLEPTLDRMYAGTRLGERDRRLELLAAAPAGFAASDDPFLRLAVALYDADRAMEEEEHALTGEFQLVRARYMQTLTAYLGSLGRPVYPDANGSLRVTFGTVRGYSPRDGVQYRPFTTLAGIREKYTGEDPFAAPESQLRRIDARDHGAYRMDAVDSVPVNYLSDVDTTGGNSGSPTLNGRGELVGLLFDGTYDSVNSDWDFNAKATRAIHVDVRYMLWVMEKVDGARRVLAELGLDPAGGS